MSYTVIAASDKETRDQKYRDKKGLIPGLVKFSEVEMLISKTVPGEILLDNKGRIRYNSIYCMAYPND